MKTQIHSNGSNYVSVLSAVRTIFEKSQHRKYYYLEDAAKTLDELHRNVIIKVRLYKWTALAVLTLIPIFSTFLSVLLSEKNGALTPILVYVSYTLTLLTLLSSIFNPGERFKRICVIGIELADIRTWALENLEQLTPSEESVHDFANKLREKLHPYEVQLVDLFLPEVRTRTSEKESDAKKEQTSEEGNSLKDAPARKAA
jgi:hypothetical protein